MSVKTAGVGHIQLPAAPAAGVSITSGTANNYTTSAVAIGTTPSAVYITGIHVEAAAAKAATYISVQLMVGASAIGQYLVPLTTASTVALGFRPIFPPIPVATATSVTAKVADSVGSAAVLVSLEIIAQSNVVDDGIAVTTVTTVTNQLTGAAIATALWQDATAGDFTVASSIGKSLYTGNVAPGGANGLLIAGSNAATTFATLTSTGALTVNGVSNVSQTGDSFAVVKSGGTGDNAAIKTKTDFLPSATAGAAGGVQIAGANAATTYETLTSTGAFTVNGASAVSQTGDAFARLGAPAGASVSADIAAVKVDTAAVKVKTDFLPSVTAGAAGGVFIAGTNAATTITTALTTTFTGNLTGSVASVSGAVGSVTGLTASNLDATISSRMATYTQPTGFLAATFPTSVASPTNITAGTITTVTTTTTATNLTNLPSIPANWITATGITASALNGKGDWPVGKTGYSISGTKTTLDALNDVAATAIVSAGAITTSAGKVSGVILADTVTTYTGNTPQTGDAFVRVGLAGIGLTNLGDTRIANLDATVSSRSTYAGTDTAGTTTLLGRLTVARAGYLDNLSAGAVALASGVTVTTNNDKTGYSISGLNAANLDVSVSSRLAPTVAGRTLDVSAAGNAGIDWANVENPDTKQTMTSTQVMQPAQAHYPGKKP